MALSHVTSRKAFFYLTFFMWWLLYYSLSHGEEEEEEEEKKKEEDWMGGVAMRNTCGLNHMVQYCIVVWYSTVCIVLYGTVWYSTVCIVLYGTVWYSTVPWYSCYFHTDTATTVTGVRLMHWPDPSHNTLNHPFWRFPYLNETFMSQYMQFDKWTQCQQTMPNAFPHGSAPLT